MSAPRILYIVSHWPGAPAYGAQQRVQQIGCLLKRIGNVSLVVLNGDGEQLQWRSATEAEFNVAHVVKLRSIARRGILNRLRHELDPGYLHTNSVDADPSERQAVLDLVSQHDVVWVHRIETANVLGINRLPHSVLDIDDIPSRVYRSFAQHATSLARTILNRRMSVIWKRRENRLAGRFDVLMVCSEDDRKYLGMNCVRILPNGFQRFSNVERSPSQPPRIGFIGTFKWNPNVEGVRWFCAHVWPKIKEQLPDVRLRIVGEGSEVVNDWGENIDGLGRLNSAGPEINTWSAMIVPIRLGGGTRIKVIEGFARKCPVVATKFGAVGYDIQDGREAFLVDDPDLFASRCLELIKSPRVAGDMARRAYSRFLECWTWDSYEGIVRAAVESVHKTK